MQKIFFFLAFYVFSITASAQFTDNFTDPMLASHWQGDVADFTINTGELQLNDTDPGSSNDAFIYAIAPTNTAAATQWAFKLRCEFSPSSGNFATAYLTMDQPNVDNFNGYYVKVGGISGSDDALELYRKDGNTNTLLIAGELGAVGADPVTVGVLVNRSTTGEWTMEADYTGGEDYDPQGTSVIDNTYTSGLYFGFNCHYTSSRSMSFFYDDVNVNPTVQDDDAPIAQHVDAIDFLTVEVQFNEPLETATALNAANYSLNNGVGAAQTASFVDGDPTRVSLSLGQNMMNQTAYQLSISNVEDLSGNAITTQTLDFDFLLAETVAVGDILITEIFADPSPMVGLPSEEYIELYNASDKVLQLADLGFSTGGTPKDINDFILLPQAYVVICDEAEQALFEGFGDVATISSFPALTNGGDDLSLVNAQGATIAEVNYSSSWYQDAEKAEGGYSLELIDLDLDNNCPGNWRASEAAIGGTPAQANSVSGVDENAPNITYAVVQTPTEVVVYFDDVLGGGIDFTNLFSISPSINIGDALLNADRESITLFLESNLAEGVVYEVSVALGLEDCLGNVSTENQSVETGIASAIEEGDLVINEVLFNPRTGGVDFVELYNPSAKILNIQGLRLRNNAISSGTISTTVATAYVLLPNTYVAITPNAATLSSEYTIADAATILENDLPSLGNEFGNITISNTAIAYVDSLSYHEDWHNDLLSDKNGVSLERLRADQPSQDQGNWHSAASSAGYATPGAVNSQDRQSVSVPTDDFFNLAENTFSPDQDGYQDVLELHYNTNEAGYVGSIRIFDAQGRLVRDFAKQELLAGKGSFLWDGSTNDGERARIGIYVIYVEIFSPSGEVVKEKHPCVVAGYLD